jgi:energy-converting hydrogenase Eha subunit C
LNDGFQVLIWALLPAAAWAWMGQPSALFCMLGTMVMACILRRTSSWSIALIALVPVGVLMALVISNYYAPQVAHIACQHRASASASTAPLAIMKLAVRTKLVCSNVKISA